MVLTEEVLYHPHSCAITGRSEGRFIDTGSEIPGVDPHIYISVPIAEEMGRMIGMVSAAEHAELHAEVLVMQQRVASWEDTITDLGVQLKALKKVSDMVGGDDA